MFLLTFAHVIIIVHWLVIHCLLQIIVRATSLFLLLVVFFSCGGGDGGFGSATAVCGHLT